MDTAPAGTAVALWCVTMGSCQCDQGVDTEQWNLRLGGFEDEYGIIEYIFYCDDNYEYENFLLSCFTQKKVVTITLEGGIWFSTRGIWFSTLSAI